MGIVKSANSGRSRAAVAAVVVMVSSVALSAVPTATAAPARNAAQLVADYKKLNVEAERSAEAMHNATI